MSESRYLIVFQHFTSLFYFFPFVSIIVFRFKLALTYFMEFVSKSLL